MGLNRGLPVLCVLLMICLGFRLPLLTAPETTENTPEIVSPYTIAVVLQSKNNEKVRPILLGFKAAIDEKKIPVIYKVIPFYPETIEQQLAEHKPALIFTVGGVPTRWLWPRVTETPMVFAKVYEKPTDMPETKNVSGAELSVPPEIQLDHLMILAPQVKTVGIIYNPDQNREAVERIARVAVQKGIRLTAHPVNDVTEIPQIKSLNIDALWIIPDTTVCRPLITKRFILSCSRLRIPILGFSAYYARAGILICLQSDFEENGKQAGEIAVQILTSGDKTPRFLPPRKINLYLNQAVASRMGIRLPKELTKKAEKVYGQ